MSFQVGGPPPTGANKTLRIVGLVLLGGVVMCGLCGSGLLVLTLVAPLMGG